MSMVRSPTITAVVSPAEGTPAPAWLQRLYDFALKWERNNLKAFCENQADRNNWILEGR
jgi:hypothetical protein